MTRCLLRIAIGVAALSAAMGSRAAECGSDLQGVKRTVENSRFEVAYATTPHPVPLDKHFIVEFAVCPRDSGQLPLSAKVNAIMPEHRHGMNYVPSVTSPRPGVYRGEGFLFHMPGRWELVFSLGTANGTERIVQALVAE